MNNLQLYVFAGATILSLVVVIVSAKRDWHEKVSSLFSLIFSSLICFVSLMTFILLLGLKPTKEEFRQIQEDYKVLEAKIEAYKKLNQSDKIVLFPELLKETEEMNSTIEEHKNKWDSRWNGYRYSPEVANLEPLNPYKIL